jgi:hypothetical protein
LYKDGKPARILKYNTGVEPPGKDMKKGEDEFKMSLEVYLAAERDISK